MEISDQSLRERYAQLNTEDLIKLEREGGLTDLASRILAETLRQRGVTEDDQIEIILEMDEEIRTAHEAIGFHWWVTWAWLGLTLGNLFILTQGKEMLGFAIGLVVINTVLKIMILQYNKYAFLVATIISFNPILWITNGVYLKNRWKNPKVNQ